MAAVVAARLPYTLSRALPAALSHTGIIAIAVRMIIAAISLAVMCVLPCLRTALHRADTYHTAGTVAVPAFVVISAVSLAVVGMIACLRTALHRAHGTNRFRRGICLTMMSVS